MILAIAGFFFNAVNGEHPGAEFASCIYIFGLLFATE